MKKNNIIDLKWLKRKFQDEMLSTAYLDGYYAGQSNIYIFLMTYKDFNQTQRSMVLKELQRLNEDYSSGELERWLKDCRDEEIYGF